MRLQYRSVRACASAVSARLALRPTLLPFTLLVPSPPRLRSSLQNFAQPLTLLVDERGIVHQAFVGSLRSRKSELVDAVARYLKSL